MRGMKMKTITCFGDRTRSGTFFIIVSVFRTRITSVSQIANFMNVLDMCIPFRCVMHYFVTLCQWALTLT